MPFRRVSKGAHSAQGGGDCASLAIGQDRFERSGSVWLLGDGLLTNSPGQQPRKVIKLHFFR